MIIWVFTYDMDLADFTRRQTTLDFYAQLIDMLLSLSPVSYEKCDNYIKLDFSNVKTPVELQKLLFSVMSIARFCSDNYNAHCGVDFVFDNGDMSGAGDVMADIVFYDDIVWATRSGFKILARYVVADRIDGLWRISDIRREDPLAITSCFRDFPLGNKQKEEINKIFYILNTDKSCICYSKEEEGLAYSLSIKAAEAGWFVIPVSLSSCCNREQYLFISILRVILNIPDIEDYISSPYVRKRIISWKDSFLHNLNPSAMEFILKELLKAVVLLEKKVLLVINVLDNDIALYDKDFFKWLFDNNISVLFCFDSIEPVGNIGAEKIEFPPAEKDVLDSYPGSSSSGLAGRFYVYSYAILKERGKAPSLSAVRDLFSALLDKEKAVYYALIRFLPFFTHSAVKEILNSVDISYVEFEEIISWLENVGLLFPGVYSPVYPIEDIERLIEPGLLASLTGVFTDNWLASEDSLPYFLIANTGDCRRKEDLLVSSVLNMWSAASVNDIKYFANNNRSLLKDCSHSAVESAAFSSALHLAAFNGDRAKVTSLLSNKEIYPAGIFSLYAMLIKGRCLRSVNPGESIKIIKEAVYSLSEYGSLISNLESFAYIELAMSMTALTKLKEAQEYLKIADNHASRKLFRLIISFLSSCLFYIEGNYTRALLNIADLKTALADMDFFNLYAAVLFLEARVLFELGDYQGSIKTLVFIEGELKGLVDESAIRLCSLWKARAYFYSARYDDAFALLSDLPEDIEHRFFSIEHEAMCGDFAGVMEICDREPEDLREYIPVYDDILPSWFTGFSMLEDRIFYGSDDLRCMYRLISTLKLYAKGMLGDESVCSEFVDITRKSYLRIADPYAHLYHLWYGEVLLELEKRDIELPDHSLTIIGKAVRLLQMRASKIENARHRRAYLFDNYWNSRLMELARRYKLSY